MDFGGVTGDSLVLLFLKAGVAVPVADGQSLEFDAFEVEDTGTGVAADELASLMTHPACIFPLLELIDPILTISSEL